MYVKRNLQGAIVAIGQQAEGDINEFVAADDAALQDFLTSIKTQQQSLLERSDQTMARVLEDVVNLLVEQGTIRFTDLPEAAQIKLLSRRELRGQRQSVDLLDNDENLNL